MSDPIDTAAERATAAIKALADAGHRQANEHAYAVDQLRQEVESLRAINAGLRERLADLEHRVTHTAEVLAMPVDTEAPVVREVVRGHWKGHPIMVEPGHDIDTDTPQCREAVRYASGWTAYRAGLTMARELTESAARIWVLDGVIP